MLRRIYITFIFLILVYWKPNDCSTLPRWVHRVDSCPDPYNISQWVKASHRLNCYHDLTSTDPYKQAVVYHCLPSSFLNETVEFCGKNVPVAPGNCPVYNYQFGVNIAASYYNCSAFASGCPKVMFHSKNVLKQPECLKINRKEKCFEAHVNCTKSSLNESLEITTEIVLVEQTRMTEKNEDSERIDSKPLLPLVLSFMVIIVLLFIVIGFFVRDKWKHRLRKRTNFCSEAPDIHEAELKPLYKEGEQEHEYLSSKDSSSEARNVISTNKASTFITEQELEDLRNKDENQRENGNSDSGSDDSGYGQERKALLENMLEAATEWSFNDFIENLKESMELEVFERIKHRIGERKENNQTEADEIKDKDDMLKYLNEKYNVFQNVEFLQGLFLSCHAPNLYEICLKYAKARENDMRFFEKKILKEDHTKVVYVINCPKLSSYKRSELTQLRKILVTLLNAQYDDVLVCGVKEGCVIVTFMIRNCLLPSLKAFYESEKRNTICQWELKFKIMKVVIEDRVFYMSDLLSTVKGLKKEAELSLNSPESELNADEKETRICNPIDNDSLESFGNTKKGCPTNGALGERLKQESLKFRDFVENSLCSMTDDTLNFIKKELQYFTDEKSVRKMDRTAVLNKMSDTLMLQFNMDYLEWLFDHCREDTLLERCQKFSSQNTFLLKTFQAAVSPGHGRQTLEFHIMVSELESYSDEILNLRCWIAKSISIHPGEILMTALKTAPIVVTFMMRKKHCGAFLEFVETDDGQIAASRKRVEKIINNGKVITFENAVNGEKFVHIHLRYDKNPPKGLKERIRNASSLVLNALGIKMEGREVYVRQTGLDNQENDKGESRTFIENNKRYLLDNLEPSTLVANHDIASLFDEGTISNMNGKIGRRERIDYFLEMCNGLPKRQFDIVLPHLEKCVSSSKSITSSKECDAIRSWIQENRKDVIEEMDSDVIDTTCNKNNTEAVSNEVRATWSDGTKGRKEKAELFLDFALCNDEYLKALKETLEENGMLFGS